MKTLIKIILTLTIMLLSKHEAKSQNVSQSHKDSLEIIVKKYYDTNLKTFQSNSTISHINKIFELFTDDFTYVHPKYGGVYSREDLYNGYVRNQKNGDYNGEIVDITIQNIIVGLNAVMVERIYILKDNEGVKKGVPKVTLFEFKKSKISKIFEYW